MSQRTSDLIYAVGTFLTGYGMGSNVDNIFYAGFFVMTFSLCCDHFGVVKKHERKAT